MFTCAYSLPTVALHLGQDIFVHMSVITLYYQAAGDKGFSKYYVFSFYLRYYKFRGSDLVAFCSVVPPELPQ